MIEVCIPEEKLTWAVDEYYRCCFPEDFIESHPMTFFENPSEIQDPYDLCLRNERGVPTIEFKDKEDGFKICLGLWHIPEYYAEEGDFRLKHLRMLFGTEDWSFIPFNFADLEHTMGNQKLEVDAASFPGKASASEVLKWIRWINSRHPLRGKGLVMVFEGEEMETLYEVYDEIPKWFGVEMELTAVYRDNVDPDKMNISLWWVDVNSEAYRLHSDGDDFCRAKNEYVWELEECVWKLHSQFQNRWDTKESSNSLEEGNYEVLPEAAKSTNKKR